MNGIAKFASLLQTFPSVHDGFQTLQGKLLLDGGSLTGSFFNRTVVLICQHSSDGAFGLVLNRGAERTVGEAITEDFPERIGEQELWVGGPVQPAALSYLHSDEYLPDANVFPNLNLDHSLEDLVELGNSFSATQRVRVFTGYSGWGPGQLEDEMKHKAWVTHTATIEHVFAKSPEQLWRIIMREMGGVNRLMSDAPDDLSWN